MGSKRVGHDWATELNWATGYEIKRCLLLGRKAMTNLDSILKSRDITLLTKMHLVKAMVFPVIMDGCWELDHKEGWAPKKWWFWTAVLEKTLESPLDCKVMKPVNSKGNKPWILIGRTDVEAEALVLWPSDAKSQVVGKDCDAGKDRGQEEKGMTEDEMVGGHHWLNGHELEQALGDGEGQGSLACCNPWGCKESDMTEQLNKPLVAKGYHGQCSSTCSKTEHIYHGFSYWFQAEHTYTALFSSLDFLLNSRNTHNQSPLDSFLWMVLNWRH